MQDHRLTRLTAGEILASLKTALAAELQAAVNYQAHSRACAASGAQQEICQALEALRDVEQEHARRLSARITALGGVPAGVSGGPELDGNFQASWLEADLAAEQWAIVEYARLVAGIVDDDETVGLLAELLADEIRHANWLKATLRALATEAGEDSI